MKTENEYVAAFGDTAIVKAKDNNIVYGLNTFDELEYDCWDLIKKYAETLGIEIEAEDDIDFYAAKEVQDTILKLFVDAGFVLRNRQ